MLSSLINILEYCISNIHNKIFTILFIIKSQKTTGMSRWDRKVTPVWGRSRRCTQKALPLEGRKEFLPLAMSWSGLAGKLCEGATNRMAGTVGYLTLLLSAAGLLLERQWGPKRTVWDPLFEGLQGGWEQEDRKNPSPGGLGNQRLLRTPFPGEVDVIGARWHETDKNRLLNLKRCKGFETFGTVAVRDTTGKKTGNKKCAKRQRKLSWGRMAEIHSRASWHASWPTLATLVIMELLSRSKLLSYPKYTIPHD